MWTSLFGRPARPYRSQKARRPVPKTRLSLGILEDRLVPTTFNVTSLADSGPGTLRDAITASNSAGFTNQITFQSGLTGTINLATVLPTVGTSVQITGPGSNLLTVKAPTTGAAGTPVLQVGSGTNSPSLSVSGLTVNGSNRYQDVLVNTGAAAALTGCVLTGGFRQSGGGLFEYGGTATLTGCTVTGNIASLAGGGLAGYGGSLTVIQSTVSGNTGVQGGGGIYLQQFNDGSSSGGALTIQSSTISGNKALNGSNGGGVYIELHTVDAVNLLIADSTVANNTAGQGGGVYFESLYNNNSPPLTVTGSTITGNSLTVSGDTGGGIYVGSPSVLNLRDTAVAKNTNSAGAADDVSGAVASGDHDLVGSGVNLTGLTNTIGGAIVGTAATPIDPKLGPLQDNGGPTFTLMPLPGSPLIDGGHADGSVPLTVDQRGLPRNSRFTGAPLSAGADGTDIGAVEVQAAAPTVLTVNTLSDAATPPAGTVSLRQAIQAANGTLALSSLPAAQVQAGSPYAAVIQFSVTGTINVTSPLPAFAVYTQLIGPGSGSLTIQAPTTGAAGQPIVSTGSYVQAVVSGLTVNGSNRYQDVLVNTGAAAALTGCVLTGGFRQSGGGLFEYGGTATLTGCTVTGNIASLAGGGLGGYGGSLTVIQSTVSGNTGVQGGGGIYLQQFNDGSSSGGALTIQSSTISGNKALNGSNGGGVYIELHTVDAVNLLIADSTVANNSAGYGGGVYVDSIYGNNQPPLTVTRSTITGNSLTVSGATGGGIYVSNVSVLRLYDTAVAKNTNSAGAEDDVNNTAPAAIGDHDLIGSGAGLIGLTNGDKGNVVGTAAAPIDPKLGPLQNNGGPTFTTMPLPGSPLLNGGDGTTTSSSDQRGVARVKFSNIGAYQATASKLVVLYQPPDVAGQGQVVVVEAVDSLNRASYGYSSSVTFTSSDTKATLPGSTPLSQGTAVGLATLVTAGAQTLTATDTNWMAGTATIQVQAAAPADVEISAGAEQSIVVTAAFAAPIQVVVTDAYGNPVAGASVTFTAPTAGTAAGASFSGSATATVTTNANGIATAPTLTANGVAGNFNVSAAVGGTTLTTSIPLTNAAAGALAVASTPTVYALQSDTLGPVTIATFTDPSLASFPAGSYTASINWGDGTTATAGTVTVANGVIVVAGSHAYAGSGAFQPTVTLSHAQTARSVVATGAVNVAADVSNQLRITRSGLRRVGQNFNGTLTITNTGSTALTGTLRLVVAGLPPLVQLNNAGTTDSGLPYLLFTLATPLQPGQSVRVIVSFFNPSALLFDYVVRSYLPGM